MFRLYHNEKDIERHEQDLEKKQHEQKKVEKRKEKAEEQLKEKKKECGKLGRELAKVEQDIRELVGDTCLLSFGIGEVSPHFLGNEASISTIPLEQLSKYEHVVVRNVNACRACWSESSALMSLSIKVLLCNFVVEHPMHICNAVFL